MQSTDHQRISNTPSDSRRQARQRVEERNRLRLEETKRRLVAQEIRKKQAKREEFDTLSLRLPRDVMERAKKVCLAVEGVDLWSFLRDRVLSYADQLPAKSGLLDGGKTRPIESDEDREWREAFEEYGNLLAPGAEATLAELLDFIDWPVAARNREALMRVGRVMRRMHWGRGRVAGEGGKRVWVYRKPLA